MEHNSSNESNLESKDDYPPYNIHLHVVLLSLLVSYIPIIVTSSTFVMCAVIYVEQLHHPHNFILFSISVTDVIIAVLVIPFHVLMGIPHTREKIRYHPFLTLFLDKCMVTVNLIYLSFFTLLGLDTFLQVKYSTWYWRHSSNKTVAVCIASIVVIYLFLLFTIFEIKVSQEPYTPLGAQVDGLHRLHQILHMIAMSMLILCFILGVAVAFVSWKRVRGPTERITLVLLMALIVFYSPTVYYALNIIDTEESTSQYQMWLYCSAVCRYLSSVTNGMFIYLFRPVYRKAFQYFRKTNPLRWKKMDRSISVKQSETTPSTSISSKTTTKSNTVSTSKQSTSNSLSSEEKEEEEKEEE